LSFASSARQADDAAGGKLRPAMPPPDPKPPPLKLEDPRAVPPHLGEALKRHDALLARTVFLDNIVRGPEIGPIAEALSHHLCLQRIHAYHCTREPAPGYFAARGLRPTSLDEHQEEFLRLFGHHFTAEERAYVRKQWSEYFDPTQRRARQGRVWTCLSRALVRSHGTEPFFAAYGGEAIYMPLADDSSAMRKLATLGQPVVVEVALPGASLKTYSDMAWSVLSIYHRRVNPNAHPIESEACYEGAVPPDDVLQVVPLDQFAP
jgi:hypothetical protein